MKSLILKILIIMSIVGSISDNAFARETLDGWLAFGDLRGYLEPCGCDPLTDLGGLKRLAALLDKERAVDKKLVLFDLGNNQPPENKLVFTKKRFMEKGISSLAPTASLFNVTEILASFAAKGLPQSKHGIPYVLSNFQAGSKIRGVAPRISRGQVHVWGYAWNKSVEGQVSKVDDQIIDRIRKSALKLAGRNVLLFSGPRSHLSVFVKSGIFDEIISSNTLALALPPGIEEQSNESLLMREVAGMKVWMVPAGGQGVLRGGRKRVSVAPSVFNKPEIGTFGTGAKSVLGLNLATEKIVTWLTPEVGGENQMNELFSLYQKSQTQAFDVISKKRAANLAESPFAGSNACVKCHKSAFEKWQKTKHSKALSTLENKNKSKDWECVTCHVLGAAEKGGFASVDKSPQFANVQCENCHGARLEHTKNPQLTVPSKPRESCNSCHVMPHSSDFRYETYWPKIQHK